MSFEDYADGEQLPPEEFNLDVVSATTPLSVELARVMGRLDPDGQMAQAGPSLGAVQRAWNEIAGAQLAEITRSVYVRKDEVVVVLSSPLWAQELNFLAAQYCEKLNAALETDALKGLKFRVS
ncbi:MAG: DUF721 domain-containing protein [Coriobacteriia bacterium]|nr:DUF721 domain-containing protein [Coriobacteriia bacterium]